MVFCDMDHGGTKGHHMMTGEKNITSVPKVYNCDLALNNPN